MRKRLVKKILKPAREELKILRLLGIDCFVNDWKYKPKRYRRWHPMVRTYSEPRGFYGVTSI